jgi:hypothetical protein
LPPTMLMPLLGSIIFQSCIIWYIKTSQLIVMTPNFS